MDQRAVEPGRVHQPHVDVEAFDKPVLRNAVILKIPLDSFDTRIVDTPEPRIESVVIVRWSVRLSSLLHQTSINHRVQPPRQQVAAQKSLRVSIDHAAIEPPETVSDYWLVALDVLVNKRRVGVYGFQRRNAFVTQPLPRIVEWSPKLPVLAFQFQELTLNISVVDVRVGRPVEQQVVLVHNLPVTHHGPSQVDHDILGWRESTRLRIENEITIRKRKLLPKDFQHLSLVAKCPGHTAAFTMDLSDP